MKTVVTKAQQRAIENQRDKYKKSFEDVLEIILGNTNMHRFVDDSEPLHEMSIEQLTLAWHGHVFIKKDITPCEAYQKYYNGEQVYFDDIGQEEVLVFSVNNLCPQSIRKYKRQFYIVEEGKS